MLVHNLSLKTQIASQVVLPAKPVNLSEFPLLKSNILPDISAQSAIIIDNTSKAVVYEKNPRLRFSMASTTKIMTALVGLEHYQLDDVLTVNRAGVEGVVVGFQPGEKVFFLDMLYAMMLPSGNDAAYAIADNYPGGLDAFVKRMNEKAQEIGLVLTNYSDPAGLDDDGNYTTVLDLARLAAYALEQKQLSEVVSTSKKVISSTDGVNTYSLVNLNRLLGVDGVYGVKTGFTQGAGEVLVTAKREQGRTFIIIVMKSEDRFGDTQKLLNLITNNVIFIQPETLLMK